MTDIKCLNHASSESWTMYHGDCVEVVRQLPDNSVDLQLYSPPFANIYTYSDSQRDMGNVSDYAEFIEAYGFLARELYRTLRPGRLAVVHCKQVVNYKGAHGRAGIVDFRGMLIRAHEEAGFKYHSEVLLWTDPVTEMQKTKAHGLLYKQLRSDSTFSRQGLPEYLVILRKWPENESEEELVSPVNHSIKPDGHDHIKLVSPDGDCWQDWASPVWWNAQDGIPPEWKRPVWADVQHTDTLNVRAARDDQDEKHMCPLSLDVIRRACTLYSRPGDVVLSPFGGVGSEGVGSLKLGRKFVGIELKESYFNRACRNLAEAECVNQLGLFA
jgi:DNA modification methylase